MTLKSKNSILLQIESNQSVEVNGVQFEWKGFGFTLDNHRWARYLCGSCWHEELKDSPENLLDRMIKHSESCRGESTPLHLVGA